jgi:hypothetical protein
MKKHFPKLYNKIKANFLTSLINMKGVSYFILCGIILFISYRISLPLINNIVPGYITKEYGYLSAYENALYNIGNSVTNVVNQQEKREVSMLIRTKDKITLEQADKRNQFLVNSLLQHQSIVANFEKAEKESRNEIRIYYFTIISALIAYIFLKKKHIILSLICIIAVIYIMYSLDAHYRDQERRQHKSAVIADYTIQKLQNISPSDSISYYKLDFDRIPKHLKENYEAEVERRKNIILCHPDIVQNKLFIYPLIFVLILLFYHIPMYIIKKAILKYRCQRINILHDRK